MIHGILLCTFNHSYLTLQSGTPIRCGQYSIGGDKLTNKIMDILHMYIICISFEGDSLHGERKAPITARVDIPHSRQTILRSRRLCRREVESPPREPVFKLGG